MTKSASIISFQKYHTARSSVAYHMQKTFHLPASIQDSLSRYQLLFHSAEYFLQKLHAGNLRRFDADFIVIYHNTTLGRIKLLSPLSQLKLSFREAAPEFNLPAYVLVTPINNTFVNDANEETQ